MRETKGIENLISIPYTEGPELANSLATHISKYDIEILEHRRVEHIQNEEMKVLSFDGGESLNTKSIIVTTGAKWRELGVPGEKEYIGKGVAFCSHCDGPSFKGKDVAVVGGGNSGIEAAIDLAGIVRSVTVLEFLPELKADTVLVEKLNSLPNVKVLKNVQTKEVLGNGEHVIGLEYRERETEEVHKIDLDSIFVQIGLLPNSEFI